MLLRGQKVATCIHLSKTSIHFSNKETHACIYFPITQTHEIVCPIDRLYFVYCYSDIYTHFYLSKYGWVAQFIWSAKIHTAA